MTSKKNRFGFVFFFLAMSFLMVGCAGTLSRTKSGDLQATFCKPKLTSYQKSGKVFVSCETVTKGKRAKKKESYRDKTNRAYNLVQALQP